MSETLEEVLDREMRYAIRRGKTTHVHTLRVARKVRLIVLRETEEREDD